MDLFKGSSLKSHIFYLPQGDSTKRMPQDVAMHGKILLRKNTTINRDYMTTCL